MSQRERENRQATRFTTGPQVDAWFIVQRLCSLGDLVVKLSSLLFIMTR
jgi:hypothetical protein